MEIAAPNTDADTIEALKGLLAATQAKLLEVEDKLAFEQTKLTETESRLVAAKDELAFERANRSVDQTLIAHMKLTIAKLQREKYGPRSERTARLLDQM